MRGARQNRFPGNSAYQARRRREIPIVRPGLYSFRPASEMVIIGDMHRIALLAALCGMPMLAAADTVRLGVSATLLGILGAGRQRLQPASPARGSIS